MSRFYDRQGNPMDLFGWSRKMEDDDYKRIARTELPDGRVVSTVWLGLNHNFVGGPPLIFETIVFRDESNERQERYTTEEEAIAGHEAIVAASREVAS